MNKEQILNSVGDFTWMFGCHFFIEMANGQNYVWSDPDYQGDNTFTKFNGTYKDYLKTTNTDYGRSKGSHLIGQYCGPDIIVVG